MPFSSLAPYLERPPLFLQNEQPFWDDPHISAGMLAAHLNAGWDGASRKHAFIDRSVAWIESLAPPDLYPRLLDLGCGPGLYAERLAARGYAVTGIDYSRRSIAYAKEQAETSGSGVDYIYQNYLDIDYTEAFDLVTLIYCDYGVLPPDSRRALMQKIHAALRPGGKFILDVFTPLHNAKASEEDTFDYCAGGGFWREAPYLRLHSFLRYSAEGATLDREIILTESDVQCYYLWEQQFTPEMLRAEGETAGLIPASLHGDASGKPFNKKSKTLAAVFSKT